MVCLFDVEHGDDFVVIERGLGWRERGGREGDDHKRRSLDDTPAT